MLTTRSVTLYFSYKTWSVEVLVCWFGHKFLPLESLEQVHCILYFNGDDSEGSYLVIHIQAARDTGTVQYTLFQSIAATKVGTL